MKICSLLLTAVIVLPALTVESAFADERPNILLILADDVGTEVLGCYGGTSYPTPRLDALAAGGLRFDHCYVMPVCHPTRTTLLTGRYPFRIGNPAWGSFPESEAGRTFAQRLKSSGYATAIAGKWQLAMLRDDPDHVARLGFEQSCVFGWHEGPRYHAPMIYQNGVVRDGTEDLYGPDVYTDFLIEFMAEHRDGPFLAYYSMALCHDVTDDLDHFVPFAFGKDRYDSYAEMAAAMDKRVGRLVDALDRLNLRERTVILFVGDNGTAKASIAGVRDGKLYRDPVQSEQNGRMIPGGKGELTDGGTHVPLIANWPGHIRAGATTDALVDASDFYPTLCELAGAEVAGRIDGVSFASALTGGEGLRESAYAERGAPNWWVRNQRWKLYNEGRLFDLSTDSDEQRAIPADSDSPEARAARSLLTAAGKRVRDGGK